MSDGITGLFRIYEYIDSIYKYALVYLQVEYIRSTQYLHKGSHMHAHDRMASRLGDAPRPMTSWEQEPTLDVILRSCCTCPCQSGAINASHQTAADGTSPHMCSASDTWSHKEVI